MPQWLEIVLRTLCSVVTLFLLTKLLGKRQVSELSFFEYITGITIGSLAAYISLDLEANWYLGLIALGVWVAVSLFIEYLQIKSKKVRDFIDFKARVIIRNGKVLEGNMKKERITADELMGQLRKKNVFNLADVELGIMESSGEINVMLTGDQQPLTPKHLGLKTGAQKEPLIVVMDGHVMEDALKQAQKTEQWLNRQLKRSQVKTKDVFLAQIDSSGQLVLDLYDDGISLPKVRQKAELYANLRKCEADLEMFGMSATTEEAKQQYDQFANRLNQLLSEAKPLLEPKKS